MSFKFQAVPLRDVYLDNINPRHDPIDNEPDIIAFLMGKEQVRPLAEHIAAHGLNPLKRMAVIKNERVKGTFISLEGNRRFCAMKLLLDPSKAIKVADRNALAAAAKVAKLPKNIEVALFDSREEGRLWLELEHGGEQGGKGTRQWKSGQKARFNRQGAADSQQLQASLMIDYARNRKLLSSAEAEQLKITTLTRFLSTPSMRDALGLLDNKTLTIVAPQDEFDTATERFLRDSLDGENSGVHSRTNATERRTYADKLRREGAATVNRLEAPILIDPATGRKEGDGPGDSRKERDNQNPDKRRNVIPPSFTAHIKDPVLKRLYDELKSIDADSHSFAATYLFRAFLEQLTKVYQARHSLPEHRELHTRIGQVADHLVKSHGLKEGQVKVLRVMASERDSKHSPETLGAFIHGGLIPTRAEVNRAWDSVQGILVIAIKALK